MITRIIPSSGEELPLTGLGTWQTFDVEKDRYPALKNVLEALHSAGGKLIDSSPMYGRAEQVTGDVTTNMEGAGDFFYATKVWTTGEREGIRQMESSMQKMKRKTMDLIQVHNLTDWKTHLHTLNRWKEAGRTRYTGITHYTDSMHEELERIMHKEQVDFVQFNYSIVSRHAELRLLDVAVDLGVATIINRPFGEGRLFEQVKGKPLPAWAAELGMHTWAAFFLKYIIAHPAVTCVIPATGNPEHAAANAAAGENPLPGPSDRKKMLDYLTTL